MDFELPYETKNGELRKMDDFEKWLENYRGQTVARDSYQEGARQCKLGHPDIFEIGRADGVAGERKRIVEMLRKAAVNYKSNKPTQWAVEGFVKHLADHIEKDSNDE